jgi:hypothetical protein
MVLQSGWNLLVSSFGNRCCEVPKAKAEAYQALKDGKREAKLG